MNSLLFSAARSLIKINFVSVNMDALDACKKRQRLMLLDWFGELSNHFL